METQDDDYDSFLINSIFDKTFRSPFIAHQLSLEHSRKRFSGQIDRGQDWIEIKNYRNHFGLIISKRKWRKMKNAIIISDFIDLGD